MMIAECAMPSGQFQGFVNSFQAVPQNGVPIIQLLCSLARKKLQQELLRKYKQTLTK